ncbi:AI-2E family transporter [Sphaerobacter sp.]|uniref:AI-2E family transporter n=1 Tax=Sphaerobacter sp. TaxID=2099654 RepID=UPI001D382817|nr:AI-2E family transporter [Sphaerobacter sp.]MBX5444915.1 AI-2E family transporter [Sphaerobacter sp.]
MAIQTQSQTEPAVDARLAAAQSRAARQWRKLGAQVRSLTPGGIARFVMVVGATVGLVALFRATWPATLPFVIGAAFAYILLPLVNAFDRVMPRVVAATLWTLLLAGLLVGVVVLVLRPLVIETVGAYRGVPSPEALNSFVDRFNGLIASWPVPVQTFVREQLQTALLNARAELQQAIGGFDQLVILVVRGVIQTIALVLGILVLPIWLLLVMKDQRQAGTAISRALPDWMEGDFWAVLRIVDRALGAYLRGLAGLGLLIGILLFGGFLLMERAGYEVTRYPLALATLAGLFELIPTFGPIAVGVVILLTGLRTTPEIALAALAVYLGVRWLAGRLVTGRIQNRVINLHPALLAIFLVSLARLGLGWALLAAPVAAVVRDLFRYTYGRLSDPPRPAGVLPGEVPSAAEEAIAAEPAGARVPLVYQRTRAPSPSSEPGAPR